MLEVARAFALSLYNRFVLLNGFGTLNFGIDDFHFIVIKRLG
ncbi:MAG: hypothetical protein ACI805_001374 [Candidatus Azotimanducaceae bacterium]|jgi:hypothetical protein